jgi:hypothetical protein
MMIGWVIEAMRPSIMPNSPFCAKACWASRRIGVKRPAAPMIAVWAGRSVVLFSALGLGPGVALDRLPAAHVIDLFATRAEPNG